MDSRFAHVGFLTPDVDYSLGVYRALGCQSTERTCRRGCHDVAGTWQRAVELGVDDWQRNPAVLPRRGDTALRMNRAGSLA